MAGLLDFIQTPEGQGLLAATFGGLAGARRGQPINSIGRAGLAGLGGYAGAQDRIQQTAADAIKGKYMQSQIDENATQAAQRAMAMAQSQRKDEFFMGGQPQGQPSPDAMPPGAFTPSLGGMGPVAPMSAQPQGAPAGGKFDEWSKQFGIPKDALISDYMNNGGKGISEMLYKRGTPDMQVSNSYAYDKNKMGPGFMPSLSTSTNGQTSMTRIGPDGMPVVSAPQGALATFGAYKGMETGLGAAAKVNLRDNPDGTKSPVSELSENPLLQKMIGGNAVPAASGAQPGYASEPQMKSTVSQPMGADPAALSREIKATQNDLMKSGLDASSRTQLQDHLSNMLKQQAALGAPSAPKGYGMTNDQVIANKAKEESVVGTAKADVQATQARQAGMDGAMNAYKLVDQALNHPGLPTATGFSGTADPRNYIPGTDAKNYDAIAKQLQGSAFLSAFAALKGGGAISEAEGAKAEASIARLQRSQSTAEYKAALKDYQAVIGQGLKRMGVDPATMGGGATGDFGGKTDAPKSSAKVFNDLPTANASNKGQRIRDTATGKILTSNGMQWKAE